MNTSAILERATTAPASTPRFHHLARVYRWMELFTFGPWLQRCRCAFLADLTASQRALVLGDGDGRFTAQLLSANRTIQVDAIDASPAMLNGLQRRAEPHASRIKTHCADVRNWEPEKHAYDLVVTHFFLDCLSTEEVRSLAAKLRGAISPSAVWVVSEFAIPKGWFGRFVARPLIWLLYFAFGCLTGLAVRRLPEHAAALRDAGFQLDRRRRWLGGLLVSEIWRGPADPPAQ
jgi:SAM-dependent methyltransferase